MDEDNRWNPKVIGAVVGLIIGLIFVFTGIFNAIIVAVFVLVGWLVAKYFAGEIDLDELYDRYLRGRIGGPRR